MNKLEWMHTFVQVAETGSFSTVAQRQQVDRSLITRQVAALEQHLGVKLMNRSTRRMALTAAGAAYLEKCRVILQLVDAAETGLDEAHSEPRGRIRMGLPLVYGVEVLAPVLLDFADQHPQVELMLDLTDQRSNLLEDGLDVSVRITAELQQTDIVRKLGQRQLRTVASPDYVLAHGTPQHPDELVHHSCLIYAGQTHVTQWRYEADGQPLNVTVRGRLTANNGAFLMQAVTRGMGIARQPDFIADAAIARGEAVQLLADYEPPALGVYAMLPSNRYLPHRVSVLLQHLQQALR